MSNITPITSREPIEGHGATPFEAESPSSNENDSCTMEDSRSEPPGDHRGKPIKIMISFRLFAPTKNQQSGPKTQAKKKTWGVVNSSHDVPIDVEVEVTSFVDFQSKVITACNEHFGGAGRVIRKGLTARPQAIFWYGSIARCRSFAKKDLCEIHHSYQYRDWLDVACDAGRSEVALSLKMENPSKVAKRAEMEDLLAAQALRDDAIKNSVSSKRKGDDDGSEYDSTEEPDPEEWDTINIHMKRIFKKYLINTQYDRHNPVFLDPANPNRYILLTVDACSQWAKALAERKDGVSIDSPPSSLPYITMTGAKRARLTKKSTTSGNDMSLNNANVTLLAELIGAKRVPSPMPDHDRPDTPISSPPNKPDIESYLDFLGIRDKDHTLEILLANGFHSHKVFKSSGLARSEVKELGLTLGVVTMLFDNVVKYEKTL